MGPVMADAGPTDATGGAWDGRPRRVVGLDGCADGWVAVWLTDGRVDEVEVVDRADEVVAGPVAVGVDMPIGLVDAPVRAADRAARELLPGRASSVFNAPPRAVVEAFAAGEVADHAGATSLAKATTGSGISRQAWALVPKILEIDRLAAAGAPVYEAHPEVAFVLVAHEPLPRKRSWAGIQTRRAILERLGVAVPDRFVGDDRVAPDDVLDAAVVAWVADGIAAGRGVVTVPDATDQRDHGHPIVIHARIPPT